MSDEEEPDYPIELQFDRAQGGWFSSHPDLPGCTAEGEAPSEAVENLAASREAWIEAQSAGGYPIPAASDRLVGRQIVRLVPKGDRGAWRPIATAPKVGVSVLIAHSRGVAIARFDCGMWEMPDGGCTYDRVTHWQPLPAPPESAS